MLRLRQVENSLHSGFRGVDVALSRPPAKNAMPSVADVRELLDRPETVLRRIREKRARLLASLNECQGCEADRAVNPGIRREVERRVTQAITAHTRDVAQLCKTSTELDAATSNVGDDDGDDDDDQRAQQHQSHGRIGPTGGGAERKPAEKNSSSSSSSSSSSPTKAIETVTARRAASPVGLMLLRSPAAAVRPPRSLRLCVFAESGMFQTTVIVQKLVATGAYDSVHVDVIGPQFAALCVTAGEPDFAALTGEERVQVDAHRDLMTARCVDFLSWFHCPSSTAAAAAAATTASGAGADSKEPIAISAVGDTNGCRVTLAVYHHVSRWVLSPSCAQVDVVCAIDWLDELGALPSGAQIRGDFLVLQLFLPPHALTVDFNVFAGRMLTVSRRSARPPPFSTACLVAEIATPEGKRLQTLVERIAFGADSRRAASLGDESLKDDADDDRRLFDELYEPGSTRVEIRAATERPSRFALRKVPIVLTLVLAAGATLAILWRRRAATV